MVDISTLEDDDYQIISLLLLTRDVVKRLRSLELSQYGILPQQSSVMFTIQLSGGEARPSELARRLFRQYHTIAGILYRMEKEGLITKVKQRTKNKSAKVRLTKKGLQALQHSTKRESLHQLMSPLSEEERQQIKVCLGKIRDEALKMLALSNKP